MRRSQPREGDGDATHVTVGATAAFLTVALGVGLLAAPVAAHQFVSFDRAPVAGTAGETVEVPINLHRVDRTTVRLSGPDVDVSVVVRDDGDGRVTLLLETTPPDAAGRLELRAVGGRVAATETDTRLRPGNYTVALSVPRGVGDETTLTIRAPGSTDGAGSAAMTETAGATSPGTERPSGGVTTPPAAAVADGDTPGTSPALLLAALFGPAVPVVALAVLSRAVSGR